MAYGRVKFIDPAPGGLGTYSWTINYSEEEGFGKRRNIERTATTSGIGVVRQQGSDEPLSIRVTGVILHHAQHQAMIQFYTVGRSRTIIFEDFEGSRFEVLPVEFQPRRVRAAHNPRDPDARLHYWTYTLELDVFRVLSGPWVGA